MRNVDLETMYESVDLKQSFRNHYRRFTPEQIDALLLSEQTLTDLELEVIEELFDKARSKVAGAVQGAKAIGQNVGNVVKQGAKAAVGQYQTGDLAQGQVDPAQAAKQGQVDSMSKSIKKGMNDAYNQLLKSINSLNLGDATTPDGRVAVRNALAAYDPNLAQGMDNTLRWLEWTGKQAGSANPAEGQKTGQQRQAQVDQNPNLYNQQQQQPQQ